MTRPFRESLKVARYCAGIWLNLAFGKSELEGDYVSPTTGRRM